MAQEPAPESTPLPEKMRAVIFKGPFEVAVEDRPVPKIQNPTDVILRVTRTALCGSDMHYYRGHMKLPYGFICGHEFVGIVEETGSQISKFKKHDEVVVPFTTSCGECFYCSLGETSRCEKLFSFGFSHNASCIDGGQAEFVRVPYADSSMVLLPTSVPKDMLVLMADVFPTGYFAAQRFLSGLRPDQGKQTTTVVVGCGPVGCCAIASALYLTRGGKVFAVDGVEERLQEAAKIGAVPLNLNDGVENLVARVQSETAGRGADVALELVGSNDALDVSLQVIRPFGKVSSIGVHTSDITIPAAKFYGKNATVAMGRCPVSGVFKESLVALEAVHGSLSFLTGQTMPLEQAPEAYRLFEQRKVHKIVFDLESASAS